MMSLPPITEPATMLTDYVLAGLAVGWGVRLWWATPQTSRRRWWAVAFFALGAGAALGGTVHGFRSLLGPEWESVLWWASLVAIGVFGYAALVTAASAPERAVFRLVPWIGAMGLGFYAAAVWREPDFGSATVASAAGVLVLGIEQAITWFDRRAPSAPWIVSGIGVAVIGAIIQRRELAPAPGFNHNDLFHVVQIGSTYLFYRGGLRFDS